jgi:glycosyltransferase involved in cell wall biosynthesis
VNTDSKTLKIAALFENAFPVSGAGSNRLLSIAKGICESGHKVTVYCVRPSERIPNIVNKDVKGIYDGVEYLYPANTTIWPESKIGRLRISLVSVLMTWRILSHSNKREKYDVILSYSYDIFQNTVFWLFSKFHRIKFAYLVDEFPYTVLTPSRHNFLFKWYEVKIMYKFFDIIFPMTMPLYNYISDKKRRDAKIEIIPMTVEPERFEYVTTKNVALEPYFAYAGFFGGDKDGVNILIEAFAKVVKNHKRLLLYVIGYGRQEDQDKLNQIVKINQVETQVIFTGKIHRDEIPKYLCNALGLVLARPDNVQAKGGFPTKLGEYLATGRPVIVTKVGEIPAYLTDNENAFLAEPGSVDSFAQKMVEVIENPAKANQVGLNGRKFVYDVFNYKVQSNRIIQFLKN